MVATTNWIEIFNTPAKEHEINFCKYCGCNIENDMFFCPTCGRSLGKIPNHIQMKYSYLKKACLIAFCIILVIVAITIVVSNKVQSNVFQEAFESAGGLNFCGEWVTVLDDGSGMKIDTNPSDIEDYYDPDALSAIEKIHSSLELPNSIVEKIKNTRALDGRQSQTHKNIAISWTYHPNYGLEILYEYERD